MDENQKIVKNSLIRKKNNQIETKTNNHFMINEKMRKKINKNSVQEKSTVLTKKNYNSVNNNDFITNLIAFSKQRKLKKKNNKLNNSEHQLSNLNFQRNDTLLFSKNNNMSYQHINNKNFYRSNQISPIKQNLKNPVSIVNNDKINNKYKIEINNSNFDDNDYIPEYNLTTENISSINYNQLLEQKGNIKLGFTQRNSPSIILNTTNQEKGIMRNNNNTFTDFFNSQNNDKELTKNKSFLNVAVSQVKQCSFLDNIREPKEGHSKGIIQMIKNCKNTSENKDKTKKIFDNKNYIINNNKNFEKTIVKCLNDQKFFDEPKIKNINSKRTIIKYSQANKEKETINKQHSNSKQNININNKVYFYEKNNKISSNNKYYNNSTSYQKNNYMSHNNTDSKFRVIDQKRYIINNNSINKAKEEFKSNNSKILYKKINTEKLLNLKKSPGIKRQKNIELMNRMKKQKDDLNLRKNINNNIDNVINNSPHLINSESNVRNDYIDDENKYHLNLSVINNNTNPTYNINNIQNLYTLNNNNNIRDNYEMMNSNNNTKSYFYSNEIPSLKEAGNKNNEIKLLKTETQLSKFNKLVRKRFDGYTDKYFNQTNVQGINILYSKPNKFQKKEYKSYYDNNLENNSKFNNINELSASPNINRNKKHRIFANHKELFLSNPLKSQSPSNSPNKIYKKPVYKKTFMENSNNSSTLNNNFIIYKDEINFINKFNEYNINDKINSKSRINRELINVEENYSIKEKIINNKHNFFSKYYVYYTKYPKLEINYIKKQKYNILKRGENIIPLKLTISSICIFTKSSIIKYKKEKSNFINENNFDMDKTKLKFEKINKNKNRINNTEIKKNKFKLNIERNDKLDKINKKIKNNKNEIKNDSKGDIIFLLNTITFKNILNIENQLTKLIIISNNAFNIQKNESNALLFINDIINNINMFIEILINKVINENKFIELYIKLCNDLCKKYLNSINELIINKYLSKINNIDDYNIIYNFKKKLNSECIRKFEDLLSFDINKDNNDTFISLINFIYLSLENEIIKIETCNEIIINIFNKYEASSNNENKYFFLYLNIYFILKFQNENNFKEISNFIDKILDIINNDINSNIIPNYLNHKINQFKNSFSFNTDLTNVSNQDILIQNLIKEDINNCIIFIKNLDKEANITIIENKYEEQYDWSIIKNIKKYDLDEIIKIFINIYIESISKSNDIVFYKSYIKYIIESISCKFSLSKLRLFHNKMLLIISDINEICKKNIYSYELFGYLIYLLIENELCDIKDINIFINKDEECKITISKIAKYIILSAGNNIKKYYNDLKNIELFKNNNILFEEYVTFEIKNKFPEL